MTLREELHSTYDNISPSPELLDKISAMMSEEVSKSAKKPPLRLTVTRYAGIAAAVAVAAGGTLLVVNNNNAIDTSSANGAMMYDAGSAESIGADGLGAALYAAGAETTVAAAGFAPDFAGDGAEGNAKMLPDDGYDMEDAADEESGMAGIMEISMVNEESADEIPALTTTAAAVAPAVIDNAADSGADETAALTTTAAAVAPAVVDSAGNSGADAVKSADEDPATPAAPGYESADSGAGGSDDNGRAAGANGGNAENCSADDDAPVVEATTVTSAAASGNEKYVRASEAIKSPDYPFRFDNMFTEMYSQYSDRLNFIRGTVMGRDDTGLYRIMLTYDLLNGIPLDGMTVQVNVTDAQAEEFAVGREYALFLYPSLTESFYRLAPAAGEGIYTACPQLIFEIRNEEAFHIGFDQLDFVTKDGYILGMYADPELEKTAHGIPLDDLSAFIRADWSERCEGFESADLVLTK